MPFAPSMSRAPTQPDRGRGPARPPSRIRPMMVMVAAAVTSVVVCVTVLALGGGRPTAGPPGLPDPGAATGWSLRLVRLLSDLTAVLTVGSLLVAAALLQARRERRGALTPTALRAMRASGLWAAGWTSLASVAVLLTAADTSGVPVADLDGSRLGEAVSTAAVRALVVMAAGSLVVAVLAVRVETVRGSRGLLLVALASLLPTALAGHSASAADPDVASAGMVVHVVAAVVWTGGLAGLLLHLRDSPALLGVAVGRFSSLALAAYVSLALSGLLTAMALLPAPAAWSSAYGAIVATKVAALGLLGVLGHLHRRRSLPALASGRARPLLRLAAVEMVLMGAALGLAAALTRTPLPAALPSQAAVSHGSGHPSLPVVVEPVSVVELATAWRPNAVVLVVLGLAAVAYLLGVRIVLRRGRSWPVLRTSAFLAGILLALVNLCSGVATYASAMISVQIAQLLVMLLPVPALLLLGAPLTLWLRATDQDAATDLAGVARSRGARALLDPVFGAALACTLVVGVYRTPLVELSLRSLWVHLLVLLLASASGLVLLAPVLGVDPMPAPRRFAERMAALAALVACLVLLAVQLRYGDRLLAGDWFLELRWGWVDPVADQRLAGAIVGAAAVATVLLLAGGGTQRATGHILTNTRPTSASSATEP